MYFTLVGELLVPLIMEISSYFYHLLVAVFIEVLIMDLVSEQEDGE
jgi:hypothetical protein